MQDVSRTASWANKGCTNISGYTSHPVPLCRDCKGSEGICEGKNESPMNFKASAAKFNRGFIKYLSVRQGEQGSSKAKGLTPTRFTVHELAPSDYRFHFTYGCTFPLGSLLQLFPEQHGGFEAGHLESNPPHFTQKLKTYIREALRIVPCQNLRARNRPGR